MRWWLSSFARLGLATAVAGLPGCTAGSAVSPAAPPPTIVAANAVVLGVVDGDTIDVDIGGRRERVRLIGIDTPETKHPDRPVECFGPEAAALTAALLPAGTPIRVTRDVEPRDAYGRLLGYVERATDGADVAILLTAAGAAAPLVIPPNTAHQRAVADAAEGARRDGRGQWGACRR